MSARPIIGVVTVAVAAPDAPSIARAHRIAAATARPMRGVNGLIGHDRGSPELSYTGPVPAAPQVRHGRIVAAPADIPYMPPAYQDAPGPGPEPQLSGLAAIQFQRLNR